MIALGIVSIKSGPMFDGTAVRAVEEATEKTLERTAQLGVATIRAQMQRTYRHETPHDRLQNVAESHPPNWVIWDRNGVYGPWLEGISRRNRTTRFKGYAIYRRNVQEIQRRMDEIAEYTFDEYITREMN